MVGLWYYNQSGAIKLLIIRDFFILVGCVLSQLKPSELYILSFEKNPRSSASALFKGKNVELFGLYPIRNAKGEHSFTFHEILSKRNDKPHILEACPDPQNGGQQFC